jgi:hypothetical protein
MMKNKIYKYYRTIRLFLSIVWRDWHGTIGVKTAWTVSKMVWFDVYEDFK